MNPAILGALIGAIPGTVAAALTTWASVRTVGLAQTREHGQWLRDRRATVYEELISTILEMTDCRDAVLETGQPVDPALQAADTYIHRETRGDESYRSLMTRMVVYASPAVWNAYYKAVNAELEVWRLVKEEITHSNITTIVVSEKLNTMIKNARNQSTAFLSAVHESLQALRQA